MDKIYDFIKKHINDVSNEKYIHFKFGINDIQDNIITLNLNKSRFEPMLKSLKNENFNIKSSLKKYRIYKYLDLELYLSDKGEECFQKKVRDYASHTILDNIMLFAFFEERSNLTSLDFPNKLEYHDIINRNEVKFYIDQVFEISIKYDDNCRQSYETLEISIIRQNIYPEKVIKDFTKILGIIVKHLEVEHLNYN